MSGMAYHLCKTGRRGHRDAPRATAYFGGYPAYCGAGLGPPSSRFRLRVEASS